MLLKILIINFFTFSFLIHSADSYSQEGGDGCYLGECPDDLEEKARRQTKPTQIPDTSRPLNVQLTQICQVQGWWCRMWTAAPVNYSCFCNDAWGRQWWGVTVPQRF